MSNTVTIDDIIALPSSPYNGTGTAGIIITNGIPSYFKIIGANLDRITSVRWFPENPASVLQETREIILVDNTLGTFMVRVLNNYLDTTDRAGNLSFRIDDGTVLRFPVTTYGRVSLMPLWQAPSSGLITG